MANDKKTQINHIIKDLNSNTQTSINNKTRSSNYVSKKEWAKMPSHIRYRWFMTN